MGKPLLKWAGGKSQLLNYIENFLPLDFKNGKITKFAEPFFGGGAVFFYLADKYKIEESYISDINIELILLYKTVQKSLDELAPRLEALSNYYYEKSDIQRHDFFYEIREEFNKNKDFININQLDSKMYDRASQIIFLNKTCFNGLFRVNKKGDFNVPFGKYKKPKIFDYENLKLASKLLQNTIVEHASYSDIPEYFLNDAFVYFDPPYRPLSQSSSFTAYSKYDFNDKNQEELATYFRSISDKKNLFLMLSNSDPKNSDKDDNFFDTLYEGFNIQRILANRMINSNASKRGKITELLIMNYDKGKIK